MGKPILTYKSVECCPFCMTRPDQENNFTQVFDSFEVSNIAGERLLHPSFKVIRCSNCFLCYKSAVPNDDVLTEYYNTLDTGYENVGVFFPTDRVIINYLSGLSQNKTILDYGCGSGRLLSFFNGNKNRFGIEINAEAISAAEKRGISILSEKDLGSFPGYFDYIILTDVYEHLTDPERLMKLLVSSLKAGGSIIISTGISDGIQYQNRIGYYWYFRLFSHLQMLSGNHINWLAKRFGLSIEFKKILSHYNSSLLIKLKVVVAKWLFAMLNYKTNNRRKWIPARFKRVRKWKYPIFDMYNKDHVVVVLKKNILTAGNL